MRPNTSLRGPIPKVVLVLAFLTLGVASRLPFRDTTLFISDSVRYALALEHYDMTLGRPHPPGNPLYVGAVKLLDLLVNDPVLSLALFSALMSGVAFLFAYYLGRELAGETAGWIASAILVVSPLFWFFGCVGMPSTGEAALSLAFALFARRARAPVERRSFWIMTVLLAASFGFRSTFAILSLPLWVYASWRHGWGRKTAGAAILVSSFLGWTALVASLSGGWPAYRQTASAFFEDVVIATKLLGGGLGKIPAQAVDISISATLGLGLFVIPFLVGLYRCITGRWPFPGSAPFLAAWAIPAALFHVAYDWAPRFGVLLLPPAAMLASAVAVPLANRLLGGSRRQRDAMEASPASRAIVLLALGVSVGLFALPTRVGPWTLPEPFPSGSRLLARNADLARRDAAIREGLEPESTLILAYDHTFHVAYFLPEYRVVGLFPAFKDAADSWVPSAHHRLFSFEPGSTALPDENPIRIPPSVREIVLYDGDYVALWPASGLPLGDMPYDVNRSMRLSTLSGEGSLRYGLGEIRFVPAGGETR